MQSLVISRLDFCNALYQGSPQYQLDRLQLVQNSAARLITCVRRHEHNSDVRMQLHWLPVKQRVCYKVLWLMFFSAHGKTPEYLCGLLKQHNVKCTLRSSRQNTFIQLRTGTTTLATGPLLLLGHDCGMHCLQN